MTGDRFFLILAFLFFLLGAALPFPWSYALFADSFLSGIIAMWYWSWGVSKEEAE